jgi:hypothetical protein
MHDTCSNLIGRLGKNIYTASTPVLMPQVFLPSLLIGVRVKVAGRKGVR